MDSHGFPAIPKNFYGFLWFPRDAYGFLWIGNPRPENAVVCNSAVAQLSLSKDGSARPCVYTSLRPSTYKNGSKT